MAPFSIPPTVTKSWRAYPICSLHWIYFKMQGEIRVLMGYRGNLARRAVPGSLISFVPARLTMISPWALCIKWCFLCFIDLNPGEVSDVKRLQIRQHPHRRTIAGNRRSRHWVGQDEVIQGGQDSVQRVTIEIQNQEARREWRPWGCQNVYRIASWGGQDPGYDGGTPGGLPGRPSRHTKRLITKTR